MSFSCFSLSFESSKSKILLSSLSKSHQQKLTDLKGLDVTNNKILEKLNIMDQNIKQMNTKISKTVTVEDLTTKFKTMVSKL
jgi:hypothetical protein